MASLWDMLPTTHQEDIIYLAWLLDHAEPLPSVSTMAEEFLEHCQSSRMLYKEEARFLAQHGISGEAFLEFMHGESDHPDAEELYVALDEHISAFMGVPSRAEMEDDEADD